MRIGFYFWINERHARGVGIIAYDYARSGSIILHVVIFRFEVETFRRAAITFKNNFPESVRNERNISDESAKGGA